METGISLSELDCHSLSVMYEGRGAQRVDLRQTSATGPTGIYRCDIPTHDVHDNTDTSVRDTVYVGLYAGSLGMYSSLLELSLALARVCCLAEFAFVNPRRACARVTVVVVCVCLSVYPSVPALAASASVETSKQRYSRVSLRLFLD